MVSCLAKVWRGWVRICSIINRFFENLFIKWTGLVVDHPWKVIIIGVLVALALMAGFVRFKPLNQAERLFFPDHSTTREDLARSMKSFPNKAKPDEFIITMADGVSSVLNNSKALKLALKIHKRIMAETGIESICIRSNHEGGYTKPCFVSSSLELFRFNESFITDNQIKPIILKSLSNDSLILADGRNTKMSIQGLLGKFHYDTQKNTIHASAIRVEYFNIFPETDDSYELVSAVQEKIINILKEGQSLAEADGMKLYLLTGRSIDDSIAESSGGDISLVAVSITLMATFATIVLVGLRDRVSGHVATGLVGIGCIAFGIGSGFGLVMLTGQYYVAFVGTLPFLVLGVGIDDMFIMLDALDGLPSEVTGKQRLQTAMAKVGASVTMTTITDIVAFAISSSTDFPAIRYFCYYALTTLLLSFVLLMTVFLAVLALDVKRIEGNSWDLFCCKKQKDFIPWENSTSSYSKKLMRKWAEFLMKTPVRIVVVLISLGLLAAGVYGTYNLDEKFDLKQLAPDGSYFIAFQNTQREYFPVGFPISIINENVDFDYTDSEKQKEYTHLSTICKENPYMKDASINWLVEFLNSTAYTSNAGMSFYQKLDIFLLSKPIYYADLVREPGAAGRIRYSRIICEDKEVDTWDFRKKAMLTLRDDLKAKSSLESYPITMSYYYREQIVAVPKETIQNLVLCSVAILVITTPYLVHPLVILIVFGGFVALVFELFGLMVIWGVSLNSISMITSIMAIGFAVDYSAHVAHSYLLASADTPEERMIEALGSIGASVFMGGFTTFLGILVLIFGESEIFRIFFKMVFGIVALGLLNGLLFLPVYLSLFVRNKVNIREDNDGKAISGDNNKQNGRKIEMSNKVQDTQKNDLDNDIVIANPYSP